MVLLLLRLRMLVSVLGAVPGRVVGGSGLAFPCCIDYVDVEML